MTQDSMPAGVPGGGGPGLQHPRAHVAWQLQQQADACVAMGSPLYGGLLRRAAEDVEAAGPCWGVLREHLAPGRGDAVALRFLAAVHRLVLTGRAPALARHYPSAGGDADPAAAWSPFRAAVAVNRDELARLVALPCQTNEVGRTAALAGGFLAVAAHSGLPLRLLEVGASAGLNLRWDRFRFAGGGSAWGDPASPVDLTGLWAGPPPSLPAEVAVVERLGCDPAPVDPTTPEGRLALTASVWADQTERLARLRGALTVASAVPAAVDRASVATWLPGRLAAPLPGCATVVYHSVVEEYLDATARAVLRTTTAAAGERADAAAPLAWLRLEPDSALRTHALTLTTWPGGATRLLARCGAHGQEVRWTR